MAPINIPEKIAELRSSLAPLPDKAVQSIATQIFEQLQQEGCQLKDIVSVSSKLLSLVTTELQEPRSV